MNFVPDVLTLHTFKFFINVFTPLPLLLQTLHSRDIDMSHLNRLDYPNDFVLKTAGSQLITGRKTIQNGLLVGSMDISNHVDGVPVDSFVTLTTDQNLDGELKLKEADIMGDVKV